MGRSTTPRYIIHVTCSGNVYNTPSVWHVKTGISGKGFGKPTPANIDKWVATFELSLIKGCNQHLGFYSILTAEIHDQHKGGVVAQWKRSEFRPNESMFITLDAIAEDAADRIGPIATKGVIAAAEYVKQYGQPASV